MGISFENTAQAEKFTGKISKVYNYTEKGVKRKFSGLLHQRARRG
jgi:hypothetical protein